MGPLRSWFYSKLMEWTIPFTATLWSPAEDDQYSTKSVKERFGKTIRGKVGGGGGGDNRKKLPEGKIHLISCSPLPLPRGTGQEVAYVNR